MIVSSSTVCAGYEYVPGVGGASWGAFVVPATAATFDMFAVNSHSVSCTSQSCDFGTSPPRFRATCYVGSLDCTGTPVTVDVAADGHACFPSVADMAAGADISSASTTHKLLCKPLPPSGASYTVTLHTVRRRIFRLPPWPVVRLTQRALSRRTTHAPDQLR